MEAIIVLFLCILAGCGLGLVVGRAVDNEREHKRQRAEQSRLRVLDELSDH